MTDEYETRQVRYGAWSGLVPPILARPALAGEVIPEEASVRHSLCAELFPKSRPPG